MKFICESDAIVPVSVFSAVAAIPRTHAGGLITIHEVDA